MKGLALILGAGGLVVLVLAFLSGRKGGGTTTIGNIGSTIVLPFSSSLASTENPIATVAAAAAPSSASAFGNYGAFNRYGKTP